LALEAPFGPPKGAPKKSTKTANAKSQSILRSWIYLAHYSPLSQTGVSTEILARQEVLDLVALSGKEAFWFDRLLMVTEHSSWK
jgi:hypothetical protein